MEPLISLVETNVKEKSTTEGNSWEGNSWEFALEGNSLSGLLGTQNGTEGRMTHHSLGVHPFEVLECLLESCHHACFSFGMWLFFRFAVSGDGRRSKHIDWVSCHWWISSRSLVSALPGPAFTRPYGRLPEIEDWGGQ